MKDELNLHEKERHHGIHMFEKETALSNTSSQGPWIWWHTKPNRGQESTCTLGVWALGRSLTTLRSAMVVGRIFRWRVKIIISATPLLRAHVVHYLSFTVVHQSLGYHLLICHDMSFFALLYHVHRQRKTLDQRIWLLNDCLSIRLVFKITRWKLNATLDEMQLRSVIARQMAMQLSWTWPLYPHVQVHRIWQIVMSVTRRLPSLRTWQVCKHSWASCNHCGIYIPKFL